jgi:hypothetical protein
MKNFLINLLIVCVSLLTICFFVTWSIDLSQWTSNARFIFAGSSLFITCIIYLIQDEK